MEPSGPFASLKFWQVVGFLAFAPSAMAEPETSTRARAAKERIAVFILVRSFVQCVEIDAVGVRRIERRRVP